MGKTKHFEITPSLSDDLLMAFKAHATGTDGGFVDIGDDAGDELTLFEDTDWLLGRGDGYFSFDEAERFSRRLDMRTDLDLDPGPIEMLEADTEEVEIAVVCEFEEVVFVPNREGKVRRMSMG